MDLFNMDSFLYDNIKSEVGNKSLKKIEIPNYITDNIKYDLFEWQKEALQYFLAYQDPENEFKEEEKSSHLLFNMATGTGKTLLMACLILYYYKQGFRHFVFFVNQNNIVDKTEDNLINPNHGKYLFANNIVIDDDNIKVKKVNSFSSETKDIEILFTSIHKLHNAVYLVKENNVFLGDLQKKDLVLLGDEAHHLNADTKKNAQKQLNELQQQTIELKDTSKQSDIERSWEHTVINLILNKNDKTIANRNALLEFTATVPKDKKVLDKYQNKIIYKFDLKDFLKKGYTKEINLIPANFDKKMRIIQALLFNWYRHSIALKYKIDNFKSVILFRSKLIEKSNDDYNDFLEIIENLKISDFNFLQNLDEKALFNITEVYQKGKSRLVDIKSFIKDNNIEFQEIIQFLKDNFKRENCIITNSKTGTKTKEKTTAEQEKLLNNLEDKNNHITAIFTVKRLTEGWDVQNLYDIVRLYEGQNAGGSNKDKGGDATVSEVQLIGRGVRYYPFTCNDCKDIPANKRKFDQNLEHDLRVLEEFYFHSDDDERYISELKRELKKKGLIELKKKIKSFDLKQEFKESDFYKQVQLFINDKIDNPKRKKIELSDIRKEFSISYTVPSFHLQEIHIELDESKDDEQRYKNKDKDGRTLSLKLNDFPLHIIKKAINIKAQKDKSLFKYSKLKEELQIESIDDIVKKEFLGEFEIQIVIFNKFDCKGKDCLEFIENKHKLEALLKFFGAVEIKLKEYSNPHIGTEFKAVKFADIFKKPKEKSIEENDDDKALEKELIKKDWYVLNAFNGTSEERALIKFLKETILNLEGNYEKVYLLRNEEVYKIHDFKTGRGFQPDFLLFLKTKNKNIYYQVFIEPKGDNLMDADKWKNDFLESITKEYGNNNILKAENKKYKLIGLPLFNVKKKKDFETKYNEILEI